MPPHSSHLLQPLDVGCFSVLKRSYGRLVEEKMGLGINHIDKQEFLSLYQQARLEALSKSNIQGGFSGTGLFPYNPNRVLDLLPTVLKTPSPQLLPQLDPEPWVVETPHNATQLKEQINLLKKHLKRRTQSPPSPTELALDKVAKGCEQAIHKMILVSDQVERLLVENQRQKRKRAQRRSYIQRGGILSGTEAASLLMEEENRLTEAIEERSDRQRQRAPPRCSLCGSLEHKAPKCSINQRS